MITTTIRPKESRTCQSEMLPFSSLKGMENGAEKGRYMAMDWTKEESVIPMAAEKYPR